MARAYNIHLVMVGDVPVAAFTVKHEARRWLQKNGRSDMSLYRIHDGGDGNVTSVSYSELVLD